MSSWWNFDIYRILNVVWNWLVWVYFDWTFKYLAKRCNKVQYDIYMILFILFSLLLIHFSHSFDTFPYQWRSHIGAEGGFAPPTPPKFFQIFFFWIKTWTIHSSRKRYIRESKQQQGEKQQTTTHPSPQWTREPISILVLAY